eukprot:m.239770 g.239770  ORF g.239770 m.239770 type:complete len:862 (-) comp13537_c0_seq1:148-2733(-)
MAVLLAALLVGCALAAAAPADSYRIREDLSCGGVYRSRNATSLSSILALCEYECLIDQLCGGFVVRKGGRLPMCHFITHAGIESECSYHAGSGSLLAIRDTRQAMVAITALQAGSTLDLRCPELTVVANISQASFGPDHLPSPLLQAKMSATCVGRQSCSVQVNAAFVAAAAAEACAANISACTSLQVTAACDVSPSFNEDRYFTAWSSRFWPTARAQVAHHRAEWRSALSSLPPYPHTFAGRGIIMVAGGAYLEPAMVLALRLREVGYKGTIQCWHIGPEEIWDSARPLLRKLRVDTRDFLDYVAPDLLRPIAANVGLRRFQLKPLSILHTDLKEVLLLDADNIPIRDPSYLFDAPVYQTSSAIFWPDYWTTSSHNPIWDVVGTAPVAEWEQESGQLLIDKEKAWAALNLCVLFNSEFYMRLLNGDKDTFRFAWKASRTPYHMIKTWPSAVGSRRGMTAQGTDVICAHTMLQHDHRGRPLFVHHNQMKDLTLPVGENFKYIQDQTRMPCRAVPKAAFEYNNKAIPCFELEGPGLSFFDDKLMAVNRSHLELFELGYASALREIRQALRPDRIRYRHQQRRTAPQNSGTVFYLEPNCSTSGGNSSGCFELVANCSLNQTTDHAPTNATDRYCGNTTLDLNATTFYVSLALKDATSPYSAVGSAFDYLINKIHFSPTHAPALSLCASLTYQFVTDASVTAAYGLIITNSSSGGAGAASYSGPPTAGPGTLLFQPSTDLVGLPLYYQATAASQVGNALQVSLPSWQRVYDGATKQRFNTAFNPAARVFQLPAVGDPPLPASAEIDALAIACKAKCLTDSSVATACQGVYVYRSASSLVCYGLADLGVPMATLLDSQCWIKADS